MQTQKGIFHSEFYFLTCYGLDGTGVDSQYGRAFTHPSTEALGPTQYLLEGALGLFLAGEAAGVERLPFAEI